MKQRELRTLVNTKEDLGKERKTKSQQNKVKQQKRKENRKGKICTNRIELQIKTCKALDIFYYN